MHLASREAENSSVPTGMSVSVLHINRVQHQDQAHLQGSGLSVHPSLTRTTAEPVTNHSRINDIVS